MRFTSKPARITITVLSILLALMFIGAGIPKLLRSQQFVDEFAKLGFPGWLLPLVGAVEVIGGVLLLIPRVSWLGASAVAVIMAGATYTHLVLAPETAANAAITLCLLAIAAFIAYARCPWRTTFPPSAHGKAASVR